MAPDERRLVYAWGGNAHGQLGMGDLADRLSPCLLPGVPEPAAVCCGDYHSALVTSGGALLTWGSGDAGQLGHGDAESVAMPRLVRALDGICIRAVACGSRHTLALTAVGEVFAWGSGTFGALGLGLQAPEEQLRPAHVRALQPDRISAIAVGVYHSSALSDGGAVLTWGWGRHGQLGDGEQGSHAFLPRPVLGLDGRRIEELASGAHHVLAREEIGRAHV